MKPPIPDNEQRRLRWLRRYGIMNTPPEQGFDDLVLLAGRIFGVPMALVTVIEEERQWFKASYGLERGETHRQDAFCAYAINAPDQVMVVEDALQDSRFRNNRLVQGHPHIRFYAGAPLLTPEGDALGTLCILDDQPRSFPEPDREALKALARQVVSQIELRYAAEEQRRIAERLRTFHELAPVGIVRKRIADGRLLEANPEMLAMTGYSESEFLAMTYWDITPPEHVESQKRQVERLKRDGRFGPFEKEYIRRDGSRVPVVLNGVLVDSPEGEPEIWSIVQDVTERQKLERMKSEFVSTVSHELRTPLTSISGSLGLVAGGAVGELPAQARTMIEIAHKNSLRLNHLINDLLDMDKLVAGQMRLDMAEQPLTPLIEQALETNRAYAEQHQVSYRLVTHVDHLHVRVDGNRFQQLMANFLSNAAKFSPSGGTVTVTVERDGDDAVVTVSDQGPGIPEAMQARVFERFFQVDASDSRRKGGTGLGLAISRELARQMGGQVGLRSVPGEGASFHVRMPLAGDARSGQAPGSPADDRRTVLVVEDEPEVAGRIRQLLGNAGLDARHVVDIREAWEVLQQVHVDALVVDVLLPGGEALDFISGLRADERFRTLPLIAISAHMTDGELTIASQLNTVEWIEKPVDETRFRDAVHRALAGTGRLLPRVLHVEDDADVREIIRSLGAGLGRFDGANTLAEARELLAARHYELVILDLGLPDGSGWALLPDLQAQEPPPPVIVLSGQELQAEEVEKVSVVLMKSRASNDAMLEALRGLLGNSPGRVG